MKEFSTHHDAAKGYWARELEGSKLVARLRQEHIVRFLASFQRETAGRPVYYLLSEWADGGSLLDLWKTPRPELSASLVKEVVGQLWGLTKALCAVHYPEMMTSAICHGNLRPRNILRFNGNGAIGTLKISSWGSTNAKEQMKGLGIVVDEFAARYPERDRYKPPEAKPRIPSRPGDVWAMGCIIFEFMVWLLEGANGLKRFHAALDSRQQPLQYHVFVERGLGDKEAKLHYLVVEEMDRIKNHPACREGMLRELINLVRDRLLVIGLPASLGWEDGVLDLGNTATKGPTGDVNEENEDQGHLSPSKDGTVQDTETGSMLEPAKAIPTIVINHDIGVPPPALESTPNELRQPCRARTSELVAMLEKILNGAKGSDG